MNISKMIALGLVTTSLGAAGLVSAQEITTDVKTTTSATPVFAEFERGQRMDKLMIKMDDKFSTEQEAAIEAGDFDTWKSLNEAKIKEESEARLAALTQENFDKLAELHRLINAGDAEAVRKYIEENDLQGSFGMGFGHGKMIRIERRGEIKEFKELSEEVRTELKEAREAGDQDKVKEILEENGIEMPVLGKLRNLSEARAGGNK
ncbi:MAG: hypothetical protein ACRCZE_02980 [Candidatus Altimarinota bacterium]